MLVCALAGFGAPAAALTRHHTTADHGLAAEALLRRSDFGSGWSTSPRPKSVPTLTCPRFNPATGGVVESGAAASPVLQPGSSGPFVSQTAYVYATGAQQAGFWHTVVRPRLIRCVEDSLSHGSADGVHFTVTGRRPLPLPRLAGARVEGYRVSGTANTTDQSIDVYLDLIVLGKGRTITDLSLSSFQQPASRRLELRLARAVLARVPIR
jgi:hypothetical protein